LAPALEDWKTLNRPIHTNFG